MDDGGVLLVATDLKTPQVLTDRFGVAVNGTQLELPGGGRKTYRGMPECPYVRPLDEESLPFGNPQINGVSILGGKRLASNLPSYVKQSNNTLSILADLPDECVDRGTHIPQKYCPFAAGGDFRDGRVLVIADHDIFINMMMLHSDNGNIDFASRCAEWMETLPGGKAPSRTQVLFYEYGVVQTKFDIPLKSLPRPPLPPPDTLMALLDQTIVAMEEEGTFAQMEQDDVFNDTIESAMASLPLWKGASGEAKIWTLAIILFSILMGVYGFMRLGSFRHRHDATAPLLANVLEKQAPAGSVLAERQEALLRDGNLWEAARDLVRRLFISSGANLDAGPAAPLVVVRGSWWQRWRTQRRWRALWRQARSVRPRRVSPRRFARLVEQVRTLRPALTDGSVRFP